MTTKPDIITAIDARLAQGGKFACVAESASLTAARDYLQETDGSWMADQSPPYKYAGVPIYRAITMIAAPGYVMMDLPA